MPRAPTISEDQWNLQRHHITRLYLHDDKELKEVMQIMEQQHNFKASYVTFAESIWDVADYFSLKMYKNHITKWQIDKRNKMSDMLVVMRKYHQRQAIGKESQFRLRQRKVDLQSMIRFMERNKLTFEEVVTADAPTPPSLEVSMPAADHERLDRVGELPPNGYRESRSVEKSTSLDSTKDNISKMSFQSSSVVLRDPWNELERAMTPLARFMASSDQLESTLRCIQDYMIGNFETGVWYTTGASMPLYNRNDPLELSGARMYVVSQALRIACQGSQNTNSLKRLRVVGHCIRQAQKQFAKAVLTGSHYCITYILAGISEHQYSAEGLKLFQEFVGGFSHMAASLIQNQQHPIVTTTKYLCRANPATVLETSAICLRLISDLFEQESRLGRYSKDSIENRTLLHWSLPYDEQSASYMNMLELREELIVKSYPNDTRIPYLDLVLCNICKAAGQFAKAEYFAQEALEMCEVYSLKAASSDEKAMLRFRRDMVHFAMAQVRHERGDLDGTLAHLQAAVQHLIGTYGDHIVGLVFDFVSDCIIEVKEEYDLARLRIYRDWVERQWDLLYQESDEEMDVTSVTSDDTEV